MIVKYDGQVVSENDDLPLMVANTKIDSSAKLEIIRKGSRKTVVAKITELRDEKSINQAQESRKNDIGVAVQNLTPEIAKSLKLKSRSGVVVSEVQPSSPAASAGIVRGDVIEEVAGEPIANVDDFQSVVRKLKKGKPVLVLVRRSVGTLYLTLKLE